MKLSQTNNGKKGGLLKGKPHYDSEGDSVGGIKAIVTDNNRPVELEGGEVIINKHASKKYWKELSKINQSAGDGVPIGNPNTGNDEDPEEYKEGGRVIEFNPNHLPNKRIYLYAKKIKKEYPKVWDLGGNIFGNEAFKNLERVSQRGYWLESEKWMYVKWRSFVARHKQDFRIKGVIAMLKWVDKVDKGWDYMKNLIEGEIDKKYPSKMEQGGKLIKRADGTYSKRGLWDNIRDNIGSGKKPTKEMLEQEEKIKAKMKKGGVLGDVFNMSNAEQFKQVITIYNELSEQFGVDNYFLDHNDNSIVLLMPKNKIRNSIVINLQKYVDSLSGRGFDIFDKTKNKNIKIEVDNSENAKSVYFKLKLIKTIEYGKGGELAKGIKSEHEHSKTIEKFKRKGVTNLEVEKAIAKDHLKENPHYYTDLKKVEDDGFTCEIIVNGERQIDAKSIEKLTKCINTLPQTKELNSDEGKYTDERIELHNKIIKDAKKGVTCISKGKPIAVLMGGSPASGKTTFLKKYRPYLLQNNLFKVDADEVRAQLPEYKGWNASQTHQETNDIVKTLISDRNIGVPCLFDFIYDGTMTGVSRYESLINFLKKEGYEIFIVFMGNIEKSVVKERALKRYQKSGRFVPMKVIDDFFETGEKTLEELKNKVDGYIVVDASSPNYEIIEDGGKKLPNKRIYEKLGETIILAKGGGIKSKNKLGDCYQSAGNLVMDYKVNKNNEIEYIGTPRLVHAEVEGQGDITGVKYGHAFIVDDVFVYDYSNKRKMMLPKFLYYKVGKINMKKPLYFEYTFDEAMKKMRETMNYGPWDLKTTSGL